MIFPPKIADFKAGHIVRERLIPANNFFLLTGKRLPSPFSVIYNLLLNIMSQYSELKFSGDRMYTKYLWSHILMLFTFRKKSEAGEIINICYNSSLEGKNLIEIKRFRQWDM